MREIYLTIEHQKQTFYSYSAIGAIIVVVALISSSCQAQDYDDEGYGNQGGNNQGDSDNYNGGNGGYGNDDGYSSNVPNYQQNVDSEGSNNQPSNYQPQSGGSDADSDYEGDDNSAAASSLSPTVVRVRRSAPVESMPELKVASSEPKLRVKRHGKYYIGPVYTYVKTDKHANFKWGVSTID